MDFGSIIRAQSRVIFIYIFELDILLVSYVDCLHVTVVLEQCRRSLMQCFTTES